MTFRRIALIAISLLALSGCVVAYDDDRGYRHHSFHDGGYHHYDRHDWR